MLLEKRAEGAVGMAFWGWFGTEGSKPTGEIFKAGVGTAGVVAGHSSGYIAVTVIAQLLRRSPAGDRGLNLSRGEHGP